MSSRLPVGLHGHEYRGGGPISTLHPFRAHVLDSDLADLADLADRLARTCLAPEPVGADADGVTMPATTVRELLRHWREEFDWRAVEARFNAHDQYRTTIDGATVHVLHAPSPEPDAVPLVLTHGWTGSAHQAPDLLVGDLRQFFAGLRGQTESP